MSPVPQDWLDSNALELDEEDQTSPPIIVMKTSDIVKYLPIFWKFAKIVIKLKCWVNHVI